MVTSRYIANREAVAKIKKYFQIWHGMLHFATKEDFMYVAEQIEKYTSTDNDEYFFNAFDEGTKFYSLRRYINDCERKLELNDNLTDVNDPDNFFVKGDILRTLLNVNLEIKLGNSIFKIINNKYSLEISDGSLRTLELARHNVNAVLNQNNVVLINEETGETTRKGKLNVNNDSNEPAKTSIAGEAIASDNYVCGDFKFDIWWSESMIVAFQYTFNVSVIGPQSNLLFEWSIWEFNAQTGSIGTLIKKESTSAQSFTYEFPKAGYYKVCVSVIEPMTQFRCTLCVTDKPGVLAGVIKVGNIPDNTPKCCRNASNGYGVFYFNDIYRADSYLYLNTRLFTFTIGATTKNYRRNRRRWVRQKASYLLVKAEGIYFDDPAVAGNSKCTVRKNFSEKNDGFNTSMVKISKTIWGTGGIQKDNIKSEHVARVSSISKAMSNKIHRTGACS